MREIIARNAPLHQGSVGAATAPSKVFADKGEAYKVELIDAIPEDQDLKIY
jgi:threonyl-tRNA synthetase